MNSTQSIGMKVELAEAWMQIENPNLSVEDAVAKLKALGNNIIKVDTKNRQILVAKGK